MAQHDYSIADASGGAFLADLNNALAAIASNNSGTAAPSTTYAYQLWADTTAGLLKQRNAANNAWIVIGSLGVINWGLASLEGATFTGPVSLPAGSIVDGYLNAASAGTRNALINANPIINQRGYASGTATTTANQYTLDRWRVVTSGQSISWSDTGNVRTVTAPAGGVEQVIEGINLLTGTYILNWTGTATATVAGASVAKGGTVALTGGTDTTVRFSSGTFSLAQLEPGSIATTFERRDFAAELVRCQRYYEKSYNTDVAPGTSTADGCWVGVNINGSDFYDFGRCQFRVTKRASPTMFLWSTDGTSGQFRNLSSSSNSGNSSASNIGHNGFRLSSSNNGMSGTDNAYASHWAASAEL